MSNPPRPSRINAVHIDAARNLHQLTTSSRFPNRSSNPTGNNTPNGGVNSAINTTTIKPVRAPVPKFNETANEIKNPEEDAPIPSSIPKNKCSNPTCESCGIMITPSPVSSLPLIETPTIKMINGYEIITQREPILNSQDIEEWEDYLKFPVPEMIFGKNKIEIINAEKHFKLSFNAFDSLCLVENYKTIDKDKMLKVSYANDWIKSKYKDKTKTKIKNDNNENNENLTNNTPDKATSKEMNYNISSNNNGEEIMEMYKPYDWTYTTLFQGKLDHHHKFTKTEDPKYEIPYEKLSNKSEPILFYDDMILYEDELGDNGISVLNIKIRSMKRNLLILQRLFIRIDNVLLRNYETRIYIDFETHTVLKEVKHMEINYNELINKLPNNLHDKNKYLRDVNYIVTFMPIINHYNEYLIL